MNLLGSIFVFLGSSALMGPCSSLLAGANSDGGAPTGATPAASTAAAPTSPTAPAATTPSTAPPTTARATPGKAGAATTAIRPPPTKPGAPGASGAPTAPATTAPATAAGTGSPSTPSTAPGVATGAYACTHDYWVGASPYRRRQSDPTGSITLLANGTYRWLDNGGTGRYQLDAGTGALTWLDGPIAAKRPRKSTYRRNVRTSQIDIVFADGFDWSCGHNL